MNYHVSADTTELRLGYIPALRQEFLKLMLDKNGPKMEEVISIMDAYGLDRDDVFEKLDEFNLDKKADKFSDIDSKVKAAFTREYNKGSHKSQALVEEQGVSKKKKSSGGNGSSETKDPDAIDEDGAGGDEDDDNDDELNEEEIAKAFKKMKGKKGKAKPAGKKKK
jgi:replication factor C subunit 1